MENLNYDTQILILTLLNFDDLCNLDIAYENSKQTYAILKDTISCAYFTLLNKRNSILKSVAENAYLNEEHYVYDYPYVTKLLFVKTSNIVLLNTKTLRTIPSSLTNFLFQHKFSSFKIKKKNYIRLTDSEKLIIQSSFVLHETNKYVKLNSKEAEERMMYDWFN